MKGFTVLAEIRPVIRLAWLGTLLPHFVLASSLAAQASPGRGQTPTAPPRISARSYTAGSATVRITGGIRMEAEVPINTEASMSDGEMTWLQFGVSGSKDPNALITVSAEEIGVSAGQGRQIFTVDAADCSGKLEVTPVSITGEYTCKGVTSYDAGTGKMSTVEVVIGIAARSRAKERP